MNVFAIIDTSESAKNAVVLVVNANDEKRAFEAFVELMDISLDDLESQYSELIAKEFTVVDCRTPIVDERCFCLLKSKHHLSQHGTAPEWDAKHYWVRME